jgi:hypothetical protein
LGSVGHGGRPEEAGQLACGGDDGDVAGLAVPQLQSGPVPTDAAFEANATCPNGNWTKETLDSTITLSSFTYTLHFDGFQGDYITITGP